MHIKIGRKKSGMSSKMPQIIDKYESNWNFKLILRISVTILCLIGLIVQTKYLFVDFISGQTIVNIRFKKLQNEKIPSFTVCYPCYVMTQTAGNMIWMITGLTSICGAIA